MIISTTENIGKHYKVLGLVKGNVIKSRHLGIDIIAVLKNLIGGEIKGYTHLLTHAREEATQRMITEAEKMGANAIIGVRYASANVMASTAEILAYGTAVKYE